MCDVDVDGVHLHAGRAVDLRHPQGAAPRGTRRLRGAPARAAVPRRRLDGVGRPARPRARPATRPCGSRWSASTSTCPTPTSRSPRRCGRAGSRTAPRSRSTGCPRTTARRPRVPRPRSTTSTACSSPAGSACAASRARSAPIRYARTRGIPVLGLCLGLQCIVIEAARSLAGLDEANSSGVRSERTPHPVISTMADQRDVVAGEARPRRHHAPGRLPGRAGAGLRRRAGLRHRARCPSGTGTATRSTTPTATGSPRSGLVFGGTSPDGTSSSSSSCPREHAPVLRRHAGPPGAEEPPDPPAPAVRRRSCGPRWTTGRPSGSRSTRPPREPATAGVNGTGA